MQNNQGVQKIMGDDQAGMPTFRDMRRDDLPAVIKLLAEDVLGQSREAAGEGIDPAYVLAFDAVARDPNNRLIVADLDGEAIACMQVTTIPHLTF